MSRQIGIFGGSFDPIHLGHLIVAEFAREQLGLDEVRLIPARLPPHKQSRSLTAPSARLDMVELALAGNPGLVADSRELRREGPSYTIDTLESLKSEDPKADLFLLLGADMLADLPNWHRPEDVQSIATLVLADRAEASPHHGNDPPIRPGRRLDMPRIDISSSLIRQRHSAGLSIRYLVPAAVAAYIEVHGLYRSEAG